MLDVGWSELLVIAVVLIVVVGPKDLPPMLRAFGKMSRRLTQMAGEFRKQFDDALNESDMGDLRQTISDVQKLHPANALRDAMNPLRQAAEDLKSDIRKSAQVPTVAPPPTAPAAEPVTVPEPPVTLPNTPPVSAPAATPVPETASAPVSTADMASSLSTPAPVPATPIARPKAARKPKAHADVTVEALPAKPVRKRKPAETAGTEAAEKPKKKSTTKKDLA